MLVLSRRSNEKIVLPDLNICVHVLEIKGDRVRLGFEAPPSVTILRGELIPGDQPAVPPVSEQPAATPVPLAAVPPLLRKPSTVMRTALAAKR